MAKPKSAITLAATAAAIIIVIIICRPLIGKIASSISETEVSGAVSNAYTVYLYVDDENVSSGRTVKFVFDGYITTVKNNELRSAEYEKIGDTLAMVQFDSEEASGTYESGTYVTWDEGEYLLKKLSLGDSLTGLHKAEIPVTEQLEGYEYYGTFEKCDVYIQK